MTSDLRLLLAFLQEHGVTDSDVELITGNAFFARQLGHDIHEFCEVARLMIARRRRQGNFSPVTGTPTEGLEFALARRDRGRKIQRTNALGLMG